jgi:Mg2+ and Co2+ transporter CorA
MKEHILYLKQRVKSLSAYLDYLERRAERQITATRHLMNQANASTNIVVAKDTKMLAIASKHEASSMKILAAVTTTFLPGAFIASLFSTEMFDWSASNATPVVSRRFWVYWSITIPLTVVTVGLWLGWEFWRLRKQKQERLDLIVETAGVTNDIA